MPTVWEENSNVGQLRTLYQRGKVPAVVDDIRRAVEPLIDPDSAKVLTALAADFVAGIKNRNNRPDVNNAHEALRRALTLLEAIDPNLDG